jgi:hypothetical protein
VRRVALVIVAAVLGGCATRDPTVAVGGLEASGAWKIDRSIDRVTGAPVAGATVITSNSSHSKELFPRPASLQLTCFEGQPIVRFVFNFRIGSTRNTELGYRFDAKPGRDGVESRVLPGYRVMVIEDRPTVTQFVGDLAGSSVLYLRIRSLNAGRTSAEFRVDGAGPAIEAAFADCPLGPPPRRTT